MVKVLFEVLVVLKVEGIVLVRIGKVIFKLMLKIMKLFNFLFNVVVLFMFKIDFEVCLLMYEDLVLGWWMEIDYLNGEIVRFGEENYIVMLVNKYIVNLIK